MQSLPLMREVAKSLILPEGETCDDLSPSQPLGCLKDDAYFAASLASRVSQTASHFFR